MATPEPLENSRSLQQQTPGLQDRYGAVSNHLALFLVSAIWASAYISVKVALLQLPPNTLALLRFVASGFALGIYLLCRRPPAIARHDWLQLAACGLTDSPCTTFCRTRESGMPEPPMPPSSRPCARYFSPYSPGCCSKNASPGCKSWASSLP